MSIMLGPVAEYYQVIPVTQSAKKEEKGTMFGINWGPLNKTCAFKMFLCNHSDSVFSSIMYFT